MLSKKLLQAMLGVFLSVAWVSSAFADEAGYSSRVVQNRKHFGTHEFSLAVGTLPLDAFTKGVTLGGSYTIHFSERYAWEVGQFNYSFHVDTDLKDELKAFELKSTPFEVLDYFAMSNFVFKPLYWKGSWLNDGLGYGELFFNAGGGYGWFTRSGRAGLNLGTGVRLYLSELVSLRFDARYLFFFDDSILEDFDYKDELWLGLGTSLTF